MAYIKHILPGETLTPKGDVVLEEGKNYSLLYIQAFLQEPGNEGKYITASPDGGETKALIHSLASAYPSGGNVFYARNACINHGAYIERMDIIKINSL